MTRKRKTRSNGVWFPRLRKAFALGAAGRRRILLSTLALTFAVATIGGAWWGISRLEAKVRDFVLRAQPEATFHFVDVPDQILGLAGNELHGAVEVLRSRPWTEADLCKTLATRLAGSGWIKKVNFVRRSGEGRIDVSAEYRVPVALVQQKDLFFLVDAEAVRLPGIYGREEHWKLVSGVGGDAPRAGEAWPEDDLKVALRLLALVDRETFENQITGVAVDNVRGRRDPRASHVELVTARAAGRIRWGSSPGAEVEENRLEQKLAILRENFRRTGRADAGYPVIDVSTFPDRFTVPG